MCEWAGVLAYPPDSGTDAAGVVANGVVEFGAASLTIGVPIPTEVLLFGPFPLVEAGDPMRLLLELATCAVPSSSCLISTRCFFTSG